MGNRKEEIKTYSSLCFIEIIECPLILGLIQPEPIRHVLIQTRVSYKKKIKLNQNLLQTKGKNKQKYPNPESNQKKKKIISSRFI